MERQRFHRGTRRPSNVIDATQSPLYIEWAEKVLGVSWAGQTVKCLTQLDQSGTIVGVVVFSRFTPGGCEITVASDGRGRWLNRTLWLRSMSYVFDQCGKRRLTAFIAAGNAPSLSLAAQLGFQIEGFARDWFPDSDAYLLGLLRSDYERLKEHYGRRKRSSRPLGLIGSATLGE